MARRRKKRGKMRSKHIPLGILKRRLAKLIKVVHARDK